MAGRLLFLLSNTVPGAEFGAKFGEGVSVDIGVVGVASKPVGWRFDFVEEGLKFFR